MGSGNGSTAKMSARITVPVTRKRLMRPSLMADPDAECRGGHHYYSCDCCGGGCVDGAGAGARFAGAGWVDVPVCVDVPVGAGVAGGRAAGAGCVAGGVCDVGVVGFGAAAG